MKARANVQLLADPLLPTYPGLRINTKLERTEDGQPNRRRSLRSIRSGALVVPRCSGSFLSPTRYESPVLNACDGRCGYDPFACRTVVSVLSFSYYCVGELTVRVSDIFVVRVFGPSTRLGRSSGLLITALCRYLGKKHVSQCN